VLSAVLSAVSPGAGLIGGGSSPILAQVLVRRISQLVPRLALIVILGMAASDISSAGAVLLVVVALALYVVLHAAAQAVLFAGGDPVLVRIGAGRLLFRRYGTPVVEVRGTALGVTVWPGPRGWCRQYRARVAVEYGPGALPLVVGAVLWLAAGGWWGTLGIALVFMATYGLLFGGTVARPGWLARHARDIPDELAGNAAIAGALPLDPVATVAALEEAGTRHPASGRLLVRLAELYSGQGRREQAAAAYRDALGRDALGTRRAKAMARNNLAWLLLNGAEDGWPEGVLQAEKAYSAWFGVAVAHTMALAHLRAGRPEKAAPILRVLRWVPGVRGVRGAALAPLEALVAAAKPAAPTAVPAPAPVVVAVSANHAPADHASAEQVPANHAPADQVPADQAATVLERPVAPADEATTVVEHPAVPAADEADTVMEARLPED
jgi:hypothetical protein